MKIITNYIPSIHLQPKMAFVIPQQMVIQEVTVYENALECIECQMRNTIRHEAEHRADEERGRPANMSFDEWTDKSRVEPIAEKAESEDCESLKPTEVSNAIPVNVDQLFQKAKTESGVNSAYLQDVKAAILPDDILGLYGMQDHIQGQEFGKGWDGSQYINVAAFFKPWMVKQENPTLPSNIQTDGIETDPDALKLPGMTTSVPPAPSGYPSQTIPTWPAVPGVGAR